ncbi:MAG: histidine phosphatase family protein [Chloroflexi bacterium]|nr:histidine phosphatase family protein [Chloroflexota bacterium]
MGGTPVRILLARHGETVYNVEGRWQGQADSPLTERGRAQAAELARALADEQLAAIYSSDLGRASNTAATVAQLHNLQVRPEARLREINVGAWTGKNRDEIDADYPGGRKAWATRPSAYQLPDGESIRAAQTRALEFFEQRMPAHLGETIVLISHGALCQAILVNAMGGTVDDLWLEQGVDNCQISRLEWTAERGLELIQLVDVRHLENVGSLRVWRTTEPDRA